MALKFTKIFKVTHIAEKPAVGRIPDWVKNLNLKVYDEIEVTIDLSMFYPTGHEMTIMNLETGKSIHINSKSFGNSFSYGKLKIEEK